MGLKVSSSVGLILSPSAIIVHFTFLLCNLTSKRERVARKKGRWTKEYRNKSYIITAFRIR
jgi:hypothetical protein